MLFPFFNNAPVNALSMINFYYYEYCSIEILDSYVKNIVATKHWVEIVFIYKLKL